MAVLVRRATARHDASRRGCLQMGDGDAGRGRVPDAVSVLGVACEAGAPFTRRAERTAFCYARPNDHPPGKIATWNVNSLRARHDAVLEFLTRKEPDVLCLQETKVEDDDFPTDEILRLGYAVAMMGQKSYNGVAIVSRLPMTDIAMGLTEDPNPNDARSVRATIEGVRVHCVYVPNGKSPSSPSFPVTLAWLAHLRKTLEHEGPASAPALVCGDFNIAPDERDVFDPVGMNGQVAFSPGRTSRAPERAGLRAHRSISASSRRGRSLHVVGLPRGIVPTKRRLSHRPDSRNAPRSPSDARASRSTSKHAAGDRPSDHVPVIATFD